MPIEIQLICTHCGARTVYLKHEPDAVGHDIRVPCYTCSTTAAPDIDAQRYHENNSETRSRWKL